VARVRDRTQGRLDVVPPTLVLQAATNELGNERAAPSPSHTTVEIGHELVLEGYVQTHGLILAHREDGRHTPPVRFDALELNELIYGESVEALMPGYSQLPTT